MTTEVGYPYEGNLVLGKPKPVDKGDGCVWARNTPRCVLGIADDIAERPHV